jgi:hypothetical protein
MAQVVSQSSQDEQKNKFVPVYKQKDFKPKIFDVPQFEGAPDDLARFSESLVNFGILAGQIICYTFGQTKQSVMVKVDSIKGNELRYAGMAADAKPIIIRPGDGLELLQRGQRFGYLEFLKYLDNDGKFHGKPLEELRPQMGRLLAGLPVKGEWNRRGDNSQYFGEVKLLKDVEAKGRKIFVDTNQRTPSHMEALISELKSRGWSEASFNKEKPDHGIQLSDAVYIDIRSGESPQLKMFDGAPYELSEMDKAYKQALEALSKKDLTESEKISAQNTVGRYHQNEKSTSYLVGLDVTSKFIAKNEIKKISELEDSIPRERYRMGIKINEDMWNQMVNDPKGIRVDFDFTNKKNEQVNLPGRLYIDKEMNQVKHRFLSKEEIKQEEKLDNQSIEEAKVVNEHVANSDAQTKTLKYSDVVINAVKTLKDSGFKDAWYDVKHPEWGIMLNNKTAENDGYVAGIVFEDIKLLKEPTLDIQDNPNNAVDVPAAKLTALEGALKVVKDVIAKTDLTLLKENTASQKQKTSQRMKVS